jgi:hypothetical protein
MTISGAKLLQNRRPWVLHIVHGDFLHSGSVASNTKEYTPEFGLLLGEGDEGLYLPKADE